MMKAMGIWGVFVIAFADSALIGMPVDFVIATYVYHDRRRILLYVALAALASAVGSIPLYLIGYAGGEKVLRKRYFRRAFSEDPSLVRASRVLGLDVPGNAAASVAV